MHATYCALCGSQNDYTVIYKSNFKDIDFSPKVFSARRVPDSIHYQIVRCNKDNLVRSNPVYSNSAINNLYKESKLTYTNQIANLHATYIRVLEKVLFQLQKHATILEIGCGNGFMLKSLFDKGYVNLYGIEPSIDAVSQADARIKDCIRVDFLNEGMFKEGMFDFIYLFQTLDHIYDPCNFLSVCYRLLSPGGFILALNHDISSFSARLLREKSPIIDIEHTYLYSQETISLLFKKCGFEVMTVFSPKNIVSLQYLLWLIPFLPKHVKLKLLQSRNVLLDRLLSKRISLKLGNLCIISKKPTNDIT